MKVRGKWFSALATAFAAALLLASVASAQTFYVDKVAGEAIAPPAYADGDVLIVSGDVSLAADDWAALKGLNDHKFVLMLNDATTSIPDSAMGDADASRANGGILTLIAPRATGVGAHAFANCKALTGATLPQAVTVGDGAFKASGIRRASLPKAETIGKEAFKDSAIADINIAPAVKASIGEGAFENCVSLESISVLAMREIGERAFRNAGLKRAAFHHIDKIGARAFEGCASFSLLMMHIIPEGNTGVDAFKGVPRGMLAIAQDPPVGWVNGPESPESIALIGGALGGLFSAMSAYVHVEDANGVAPRLVNDMTSVPAVADYLWTTPSGKTVRGHEIAAADESGEYSMSFTYKGRTHTLPPSRVAIKSTGAIGGSDGRTKIGAENVSLDISYPLAGDGTFVMTDNPFFPSVTVEPEGALLRIRGVPGATQGEYGIVMTAWNDYFFWGDCSDVSNASVRRTHTVEISDWLVTFAYPDGLRHVYAADGGTIAAPEEPTRPNAAFTGWYMAGAAQAWDFDNDRVTGNVTLIPGWGGEAMLHIRPSLFSVSENAPQQLRAYLPPDYTVAASDDDVIWSTLNSSIAVLSAGTALRGNISAGKEFGTTVIRARLKSNPNASAIAIVTNEGERMLADVYNAYNAESAHKNNWDAIMSRIDTLNNDSQIENIKLQNLLEKRTNAFEMATRVMDTNNESIQSILRNLSVRAHGGEFFATRMNGDERVELRVIAPSMRVNLSTHLGNVLPFSYTVYAAAMNEVLPGWSSLPDADARVAVLSGPALDSQIFFVFERTEDLPQPESSAVPILGGPAANTWRDAFERGVVSFNASGDITLNCAIVSAKLPPTFLDSVLIVSDGETIEGRLVGQVRLVAMKTEGGRTPASGGSVGCDAATGSLAALAALSLLALSRRRRT
ncbi:leucine-rich repeat protein [Synergistaceae bacterium OttesenSCG-928-I11]|nr:leucine-rich repeat protein [Synergistaceae bacterium OttesenSCG-928-I11]